MQTSDDEGDALVRAHRRLDATLGRFLSAASAGALEPSRAAIRAFDEELRRHTAFEEETPPAPAGRKLVPREEEPEEERLVRELRLEHVQIRELSAMMRRLIEDGAAT